MGRAKGIKNDKLTVSMPTVFKSNVKIEALKKGYDTASDYIIFLLKQDGVKDDDK